MSDLDKEFYEIERLNKQIKDAELSLQRQSKQFWNKLESEVKTICEAINTTPEKLRVAKSRFDFEEIEYGFQISATAKLPAFYLTVKNNVQFISVQLDRVVKVGFTNRQTVEKEEDFSFTLDANANLQLIPLTGKPFTNPREMAIYLLRPLWS